MPNKTRERANPSRKLARVKVLFFSIRVLRIHCFEKKERLLINSINKLYTSFSVSLLKYLSLMRMYAFLLLRYFFSNEI